MEMICIVHYFHCLQDYFIEVETSRANEAGTHHIGWLQIKGRLGISPILKLTDPDGKPVLQTGSTDTFRMTCESLGALQQIYVGLVDPNLTLDEEDEEPKYVNLQLNRQNQWNCRSILVSDGRDGETYLFNINQWIMATPEVDRRNCVAARPAELRITQPPKKKIDTVKDSFDATTAPTVTYRISIETGDEETAGTTANAYITLYGNQKGATSGSQRLQRISNLTFARGQVDVFFISCAKLGACLPFHPHPPSTIHLLVLKIVTLREGHCFNQTNSSLLMMDGGDWDYCCA
ncbi:unnamed protein product [Hydatigera taeniaeformis]|uniref:PLAT domain-containing protein n=1 Tax=Hydatigena taeniaeformis TaxID=6205 RepID=A0A0R3XD13_HYDTA|nr:unnamed protein product [Hydatigera taeniaeformis]